MAKRSPEAKARDAKAQQRKAKQSAAVKAKATATIHTMVKEANAQLDNNVVALQPGSANAVIKPENNFDLSIKLSAPIDPRTADNKPNMRRIEPTEDQLKAADELANLGAIDFDAALNSFKATIAEAQWKAHVLCVAVAIRIQREGEAAIPLVQKLLDAAAGLSQRFTMVRVNAIEAWLLHYAPIKWDADQKEYRLDTAKHRKEGGVFGNKPAAWIKERTAVPFFIFKPAPTLQEFNLLQSMQELLSRAHRIQKMDPAAKNNKYKKVNLDGMQQIERALKALENKAEDNAEEKEEAAAA